MSSQIVCNFCGIILTPDIHHTATVTAPPDINHASGQTVYVDFGPECINHTFKDALND